MSQSASPETQFIAICRSRAKSRAFCPRLELSFLTVVLSRINWEYFATLDLPAIFWNYAYALATQLSARIKTSEKLHEIHIVEDSRSSVVRCLLCQPCLGSEQAAGAGRGRC